MALKLVYCGEKPKGRDMIAHQQQRNMWVYVAEYYLSRLLDTMKKDIDKPDCYEASDTDGEEVAIYDSKSYLVYIRSKIDIPGKQRKEILGIDIYRKVLSND